MNKLYVITQIILIVSKDIYVVTVFRQQPEFQGTLTCNRIVGIIEKLVPEII